MFGSKLTHLIAVARVGSFTTAAAEIGVTQSTVTKSVADLEREVGYPIFYRTGRGAILTEKGRDFCERAARLLEDANEMFAGSAGASGGYSGIVRIGVGPASLEWLLAKPAAQLLKKHPGIRFDISGGSFERVVHLLRNGSVDVAIGFESEIREYADLRREHVGMLAARLFVRREHPVLTCDPVQPQDLAKYDIISPSDSRPHSMAVRHLAQILPDRAHENVHTIDYFPIAREIVRATDAVGVVATPFARTRSFRSEFVMIDSVQPFIPLPVCCAMRERWDVKAVTKSLIATIRQLWPK